MIRVLQNNRGIALILTILVVSLIVAFTIQFNRTMRTHVMSSAANENQLKALYTAKSGISCALAMLREYASPEVTTLFELKSKLNQEGTEIEEICDELEELSPCSLGKFKLLENCEFEIIDECGKIQLNSLPEMEAKLGKTGKTQVESLLKRYLGEFGLKSAYYEDTSPPWYTILNWIDTDENNRGVGFDFSEDNSKNGPLYSLNELRLIEGLRPESLSKVIESDDDMLEEEAYSSVSDLFDDIIEHLTVFVATDGKININTASLEVLMSLHEGMNEDMAAEIKAYRCGKAVNSAALESPTWYRNDAHVDIDISKELITTTSNIFRIDSTGSFGDLKKRIVAVVKRQDEKEFQILSWKIE